jgi:hypothetical protein
MSFCPRCDNYEDSNIANFEAQSRGFSIRCLRFAQHVTTLCARLSSGWRLAFTGWESNPLDSIEKF